jgi:hypothetical protein
MFGLGVGAFLIAIGLVAEWLIKRRMSATGGAKLQKVKDAYMWIAWVFAALGAVLISPHISNPGLNHLGAGVLSLAMLLVLAVDVVDKRPDWPAFAVIVFLPTVMHWTGGPLGHLYAGLLACVDSVALWALGAIGG